MKKGKPSKNGKLKITITELMFGKTLGTFYKSDAHEKQYQLRRFPIKNNTNEPRELYLLNRDGDIITETAAVWVEVEKHEV